MLQFILLLLDYILGNNKYTSALISSIAVLEISAESGWLSPLIYTPKQSTILGLYLRALNAPRARCIIRVRDRIYTGTR
jgi:hypothetical protein